MEALAVVGGIASTAQLLEVILKTSSTIIKLIEDVQYVPEEFRRLQLTLRSMQAKLQVLGTLLATLPVETDLPPSLWQDFRDCLVEVQKDFETVVNGTKSYGSGSHRISSLREKFRYRVFDQKALVKSVKHLMASEENLQRIQNSIHLHLTTITYRNTAVTLASHNLRSVHPSNMAYQNRRIRSSLFKANSLLRTSGLYGWLITEGCKGDMGNRTLICLGLCFPLWLMLVAITLEFSITSAPTPNNWPFRWSLQVQNRVLIDSPLMKACQQGNVSLIRQILKEGSGSINDRTICSGKTALLMAISERHLDAVECLLQNGADPNSADDNQVTPLFAVAGMDPHGSENLEQIPPTWELWLDTFRLLVKNGVQVSDVVRGRTLAGLNVAGGYGLSMTLQYLQLLAAEDSIQLDVVSGHQCWSALQNALRSGSDAVDCLKLLQSSGVNLAKVMNEGLTALHLASEWCIDSQPLQYLCSTKCGQLINKQDQWGWTPLHYALIARNSAVSDAPFSKAIMLVQNGANMSITGGNNPHNHYHQPNGSFTPLELLKFARPARFDLLVDTFTTVGIEIAPGLYEDMFHDAKEYMSTESELMLDCEVL